MIVPLLSTSSGPLDQFTSATWRHGVSDVGYGQVEADPGLVDVQDIVDCAADGVRFRWRVEDEDRTDRDTASKMWSGRGLAADLERTIVLPDGYPSHSSRTREFTGHPLAIWRTLALEAQGRGRLSWLTIGFTGTADSDGTAWTETVDVELEPGVDLLSLLDSMCEVEGAEWIVDPDGTLRVAPQVGTDLSSQVVLFVGRDQLSRSRRESSRDVRQVVYLEASTGVSEATSSAAADAGEVWLESEDFADPTSRAAVASKLASNAGAAKVEVEVEVSPDVGLYDTFQVGDLVGLDDGMSVTPVRVVAATVSRDAVTRVELTLVDQVELRRRTIERAIEAKADVKLAASVSLQRRHGLVRADKIETGTLRADADISSSDFVAGSQGWRIRGNGDVEFDRGTFRGNLSAAGGTFSGNLSAAGGTFTGTLSGVDGTFSGSLSAGVSIISPVISGGTITGSTVRTASSGQRVEVTNLDDIRYYDSLNRLRGRIYWSGSAWFVDATAGISADLYLRGDSVIVQGAFSDGLTIDGAYLGFLSAQNGSIRIGEGTSGVEVQSRPYFSTSSYQGFAASFFRTASSERYKENISDAPVDGLTTLRSLKVREYEPVDDSSDTARAASVERFREPDPSLRSKPKRRRRGFIAEELPAHLQIDDGYDLVEMVSLCVQGIQELSEQVEQRGR